MSKVILRVQSTECTLQVEELTIVRILAEARAVGLKEFAVMRNGEEVENPDDLLVSDGDVFVILPADYEDVEITVNIANDDDINNVAIAEKNPDDSE